MGKKKPEDRLTKNEKQLRDGIALIEAHALFKRLRDFHIRPVPKTKLGKDVPARVHSDGTILLNQDCDRSPKAWAYMIAHCMLHHCFGHFDADKMPGYTQQITPEKSVWIPRCDPLLWNMACDIYIAKFLADIKFGVSDIRPEWFESFGRASSEQSIYAQLLEKGTSPANNPFGTAGELPDMIGVDQPLTAADRANRWFNPTGQNQYAAEFAEALAESVSEAIEESGNHPAGSFRKRTVMENAAGWFIDSYPLLGGLAAGFEIVEITGKNEQYQIEIAAVDAGRREIYVNGAAGLNFEEWKFVLAHEYLHAGLEHESRRNGRDAYLWNIACDFVINGWLNEMQIGIMPQCGLMYDEELRGRSAEEIYDMIVGEIRRYSKLKTFRGYGKGDLLDRGYSGGSAPPTTLDDFCRNALYIGLEYQQQKGRGLIPAGLIEEIRALSVPPVPWDAQLAKWFDLWFAPLEKRRSYARPSRRQSATPDIPRPRWLPADIPEYSRTYGVIIDTSGSMSPELIGKALGAAASYSVAKDVPLVRVVFCDAQPYDIGYMAPEDIAGRVMVEGRGGTVLQPAVDLLETAKDFPKDGPILIITDAMIEHDLKVHREHAFLIPEGSRLPFHPRGKVFYLK